MENRVLNRWRVSSGRVRVLSVVMATVLVYVALGVSGQQSNTVDPEALATVERMGELLSNQESFSFVVHEVLPGVDIELVGVF